MERDDRSVQYGKRWIAFAYLQEMRPKQWVKNVLVFAAPVFNGSLFRPDCLSKECLIFLAYCLASSGIYVFNDLIDAKTDRVHPDKCRRPIASGALTTVQGIAAVAALLSSGLALAPCAHRHCLYALLVYVVANIAYSLKLKHVVIIDVLLIASGFVLRALSGAMAIQVAVTPWFVLCVLFLSLFLALGKRRQELLSWQRSEIVEKREVLRFYSLELIDQMMTIVTTATIMCYALFAIDPNTKNSFAMVATIPLVLYGLFYYLYLVRVKHDRDSFENMLLKKSRCGLCR